ncbi:aldehyde dehydrogenase [Alkalihalophilus pseudofirmus]|uniref:Aldehyde dehydrogenase n=1 Tax=Alkalihalophilus pseudofirmus TaxID=79885 RepID=A0AAJ2NQF5_ALKPS|nr:aldehyde dehydrogenase [Alkalihalophilus pseudofirmus]MDV2886603.1 aldehyde dehydrogenase [Alkalihalophilus pseudofirmus]WEG17459.1 aldehyde dehydrogenase [Alkalihalophilus pseudofirmus]
MFTSLREKQKHFFYTGQTKEYAFRKKQLERLKEAIQTNEAELLEALKLDLNKTNEEAFLTELGPTYQEINHTLKHLKEWMEPEKVKTPASHVGSVGKIHYEPYGVALIIAPWNYPLQLALSPLVGAISAGNCAIVKPSELTPHTSKAIAKLLDQTFDEAFVKTVEGAVDVSQALLKEPFDYIFFTGSVGVGKIVMEAASKNLTPITLELGGKSPAIVHEDAKLDLAAKRIAWGKFLNAGQTCVAPDYVLVHERVYPAFLKKVKKHTKALFDKALLKGTYPQVVSGRHLERLAGFLSDGQVELGGQYNKESRTLTPTILTEVNWEASIMKEEIFGPILPIFTYQSLDEVLDKVRDKANPLALYVFTENKKVEALITENLSFGGGCINDTVMHLATPYLPFGGVGESGTGAYHGVESFRTFSHRKSILKQSTKVDLPLRYKQGKLTMKVLRKLFN